MNINDLPEVKHLSDTVQRIERNERTLAIQLEAIDRSDHCTYRILGKVDGYSMTVRLGRGELDMDGCHIGREVASTTLQLLANKKQQLLERLRELGVQFPASTKQPRAVALTEDF